MMDKVHQVFYDHYKHKHESYFWFYDYTLFPYLYYSNIDDN